MLDETLLRLPLRARGWDADLPRARLSGMGRNSMLTDGVAATLV